MDHRRRAPPLDAATVRLLQAQFSQSPQLTLTGAEALCARHALACPPQQVYRWFSNRRNKPSAAKQREYEAARKASMAAAGSGAEERRPLARQTMLVLRAYLTLQPRFTQAEVRAICSRHALPHSPMQVAKWLWNARRRRDADARRAQGVSPQRREKMDQRNDAKRARRAQLRADCAWSERCWARA